MTQEKLILEYLESGKSLTSLEALEMFGCFRLASRISDLRKKYPELNLKVKTVKNEDTGKHYAEYKIETKKDLFDL